MNLKHPFHLHGVSAVSGHLLDVFVNLAVVAYI